MNRFPTFFAGMLLLLLVACSPFDRTQSDAEEIAPAESPVTVVPEENGRDEVTPVAPATAEPQPTKITESPPEGVDDTQPSTMELPGSTLFDTSWDDRSLFEAGLISSEIPVLDSMSEATVYHMELQIENPELIRGRQEIQYTNTETEALSEIVLHLFAPSLGGDIAISEVSVNGAPVSPSSDEYSLTVPLTEPLPPGGQVVLGLEFQTTLPEGLGAKYGVLAYSDDILALAHSAPQVAVYDDTGWHTGPSAPHGDETFSDASLYLVRVIAPVAQNVVISGVEIDRQEDDDTQTITVVNGPARDFYLAMSLDLEKLSEQAGEVTINSYAPAEFAEGAQMALDVATQAVNSFSTRYGPYPYRELDIVTTPTLALGIEYPGVFANTLRMYDLSGRSQSGISNAALLESTTAHETAHQWFYNIVGNDQLGEPWLDEALAQYATWMYFVDRYGEANAQGYYDSLDGRWARTGYEDVPIGLPADAYSGSQYGSIVYGRGPVFLKTLADQMGRENFDAFLLDYATQERWHIASTDAFKSLAEAHCGCDLTDLFQEWVLAAN